MAALHIFMHPRIICTNTISELDTIDQSNDGWDAINRPLLDSAALDIHLHCEYAAKECQPIVDILDRFIAQQGSDMLPMVVEMCIRQAIALVEANEVLDVVRGLMEVEAAAELGLKEMGRRGMRVVSKLDGVERDGGGVAEACSAGA